MNKGTDSTDNINDDNQIFITNKSAETITLKVTNPLNKEEYIFKIDIHAKICDLKELIEKKINATNFHKQYDVLIVQDRNGKNIPQSAYVQYHYSPNDIAHVKLKQIYDLQTFEKQQKLNLATHQLYLYFQERQQNFNEIDKNEIKNDDDLILIKKLQSLENKSNNSKQFISSLRHTFESMPPESRQKLKLYGRKLTSDLEKIATLN